MLLLLSGFLVDFSLLRPVRQMGFVDRKRQGAEQAGGLGEQQPEQFRAAARHGMDDVDASPLSEDHEDPVDGEQAVLGGAGAHTELELWARLMEMPFKNKILHHLS